MTGYVIAHVEEIEEANDGRCPWRPVRHHFGITAFGVSTWTGQDARPSRPRAVRARRRAGGRACWHVRVRSARRPADGLRREPGTTVVAIGGIPGKAYVPTGWEVWAPFHPVYESGGYDEVIDRGRELIEATGYPEPLFNLACCESLAGRTADAIRHLRLALERTQRYRERLRSLAAIDTDFDPIRHEPEFQELIDPTPSSRSSS